MINIYQINEYAYCPRRYWYIKHGINPTNEHLEEGTQFHKRTETRKLHNLFFENKDIGLKGKIDYFTVQDRITLYELKKGKSRHIWTNDKLQTLAYMFLARKNNFKVKKAFVKYQDKKFEIDLNKKEENELKKTIKQMQNLSELPPRCENINKCNGCNLKQYCWI